MAARQHGLVTHEQASAAGLTHHQVRHLVDRGHWQRRGVGLFAAGGAPHTWEQDVMAACLVSGGVASHECAARLLDLGRPAFGDAGVSITLAHGGSRRRALAMGATVHTTRHLTPADRARVYDRLAGLVPLPVGVSREMIMGLDKSALDEWWLDVERSWFD